MDYKTFNKIISITYSSLICCPQRQINNNNMIKNKLIFLNIFIVFIITSINTVHIIGLLHHVGIDSQLILPVID
jgi:hypothetical protein